VVSPVIRSGIEWHGLRAVIHRLAAQLLVCDNNGRRWGLTGLDFNFDSNLRQIFPDSSLMSMNVLNAK
jgi:hypothetical protein